MKKFLALPVVILAIVMTSCAPVLFGGAATGGVVAANNRTAGSFVEDEVIEIKALRYLLDEIGDNARYSVVSINRVVLIVGQVPDESIRARTVEIVSDIENVRRVIDETVIGPQISFKQQASDSLITAKIKSNFLQVQEEGFSSLNIKVLTENSVVYLMGLDTKKNAAKAVEIAREVSGVRQVVKAFEYLPDGS